eukprot:TRINITY_DN3212_c0_g1_i1.p2 TRINITY_DN3212_c0_g1~~TRINITY_DN3212_c0_g1_i1.p2  ORF type:complete len:50 (-),score=4.64 TRINITY_DN3212_c0_g1_i1:36-185(-)
MQKYRSSPCFAAVFFNCLFTFYNSSLDWYKEQMTNMAVKMMLQHQCVPL